MGQLELIIALVGFVGTNAVVVAGITGAVLYLRADARANRQEWKAESEANRQEWKAELAVVVASINSLKDDVAQLDRRLTTLEAKVDAVDAKLDSKAEELSAQSQRNHRELLIRLAFHHHGDGRYPVAPATDPDPVDPNDTDR
ncbi:MAG: hypothetical protein OXE87_09240 [Chloroflexi bacterium]|nr:hypothetical protein [Chloroflexota bacterium]